jgi:type II secretory pathway pseudopilin PulG
MVNKQKGMSLAEVLIAVGILATLIFATMTVTTAALRGTKDNMDRQFATQKAISMLEELKALVQVNTGTSITVIDDYNDAGVTRLRLTTQGSNPNGTPGDALSGNVAVGSGWLYSREISVRPLTDQADPTLIISSSDVRLVRVRVFRNRPNGQQPQLLAEVASIVRTLAVSFPPSQVYDVYCIAVENVPGWWVNMSTLITFAQNAISDLQTRHPGLVFRQRMITTLAYGRDSQYQPYINTTDDSTQTIPSVYFYPGLLPDTYSHPAVGSIAANPARVTAAQYYYPPGNFSGRYKNEDGPQNEYSATLNPFPYTLADQYNHAMRYEDELALYNNRLAAVDGSGSVIYQNEQPTLRLLLDDMSSRPWLYQNAIVINLHGELLPFPPVRNYSDAAKKPDYYVGTAAATPNGVRVVTHPEQIAYNTDNTTENGLSVNLRVYSYLTHPENAIRKMVAGVPTVLNAAGANNEWLPEPITVVLKGITWIPTAADISAITGGVDFDRSTVRDAYSVISPFTTDSGSPANSARMYFTTSTNAAGDTVIKLYNSPLVAPCATPGDCDAGSDSGGIEHNNTTNDTRRLYGMEYIPAPLEDFASGTLRTAFSTNLATLGDKEKNTARWVIKIPTGTIGSRMLAIETRIGDYSWNAGTSSYVAATGYAEPPNLSRTFVYRGSQAYLFGNSAATPPVAAALPMSERFQFQGDPRHCPYADLKKPHTTNSAAWHTGNVNTFYGQGYNRYFDGFRETAGPVNRRADWPGWSYSASTPASTPSGSNNYGIEDSDDVRWNGLDVDVPRIFQVWRGGLMKTNSLFTTMTGYPFFYLGTGDEIGYDTANGFPSSIPVSKMPFDPTVSTSPYNFFEHSIGGGTGVRYIQEGNTGPWWGMNWLGELYPDTWYSITSGGNSLLDWKDNGNLKTGTSLSFGAGTFRRVSRDDIVGNTPTNRTHTPGTTLQLAHRVLAQQGIAMFYGSSTASTIKPDCCTDNDPLDTGLLDSSGAPGGGGTEISTNYNFPLDSPMPAWRPFLINGTANGSPDSLGQPPYGGMTTISWLRKYYDQNAQATHSSSAALAVREGSTQNAMYIVANGLSPTGTAGTEYLARWAFLSLIQSYFEGGLFNSGALPAVSQLPRVTITAPNLNTDIPPSSTDVTVSWALSWLRWDGRKYTNAYAANFSESSAMSYYVTYSRDNGATWTYAKGPATAATPGVRSSDNANKTTATSYLWPIPVATFPAGAYIIRVEAYRDAYPLHYAFHQYQMFLNR